MARLCDRGTRKDSSRLFIKFIIKIFFFGDIEKLKVAIWTCEHHPTKVYRKKEIVAADFDFSLQFPKVRLIQAQNIDYEY